MRIAHVANTDYFCAFLLRGQLQATRAEGHRVDVVCGSGPLLQELRDEGFGVHVVENSRRVDPFADLRTLRDYVGLFRRERYDVVHTHNPKVNALAALAARLTHVPRIVSTVHGLYSHERQRPSVRTVWRAFEALSARLADLVLCQSAEDVRTARWRRIVPDGRLRRLGNGVDLTRFSPDRFGAEDRAALRRRLGVRAGEHVVGFVGRLVREKGVLELLGAVGPPGPQALADWAGRARRQARRPRAWRPHGGGQCALAGPAAGHATALAVLALPSHREGFPRTLLEASAMERPVVATAIRGCREAVLPRETGLLVPPAQPGDLRSALDALRGDAARRRALGRAARIRARALFDERAVFERIALAYRELALPGGAASSPAL